MNKLFKCQLLFILTLVMSSVDLSAQIDPTPFLGNVNMHNGRVNIDWTIEAAGGNAIALKNDRGYVKLVKFNGNDYTNDKNQAIKFFIDNGNSANTLRSVEHPDSYYTHKGGNYVMHSYMHDGSNWVITSRMGIDPTPYLGAVTLKNQQGTAVVDWVIESAGGNNVVLKDNQGYVKQVIWNGNAYTNNKSEAFQFFMENKDGGVALRDVNNPDMYYTAKFGNAGNIPMHPYTHDGSTWTITKR